MGKIAVLINNKSIELIVTDKSKKLEFPADVLKNQEILNSRKYTGMVTNFFNENNLLDEKVVILLSQEILYEKKISFLNSEEEQKKISDFLNTIPFDNKKISLLKIPDKDDEIIIATNRELYSFLMEVCIDMKLQVETIIPLKTLGEIGEDAIVWKAIPPLLDKIDDNSPYNFLSEAHEVDPKSTKKYWIIVLILLLAVGIVISGEFLLKYKQQLKYIINPTPSITTEPVLEQSSSSAEKMIVKNQLKIEVLNGTGTPGLAAEIRDQLLKLGYTIVETGNFEGTSSGDTKVAFLKNVSSDDQDEIINLLKKSFSSVISSPSAQMNFDISIITGEKL